MEIIRGKMQDQVTDSTVNFEEVQAFFHISIHASTKLLPPDDNKTTSEIFSSEGSYFCIKMRRWNPRARYIEWIKKNLQISMVGYMSKLE